MYKLVQIYEMVNKKGKHYKKNIILSTLTVLETHKGGCYIACCVINGDDKPW